MKIERINEFPVIKDSTIAILSSIISTIIEYPYHRIRLSSYLIRTGVHNGYPFPSLETIKMAYNQDGIGYFWGGVQPSIIRNSVSVTVLLTVKNYLTRNFVENKNLKNHQLILSNIVCGSIAGFVRTITTQILSYRLYDDKIKPFKLIGLNLFRGVLYGGISFGIYDTMTMKFPELTDQNSGFGVLKNFSVTLLSMMMAGYVVSPVDYIHRRFALQSQLPPEKQNFHGFVDGLMKIYKLERIALYRNSLRLFPYSVFINTYFLFFFNQITLLTNSMEE